MTEDDVAERFVPKSTADLVAEAERQLGEMLDVGREQLRRIQKVQVERKKDMPLAAGETRALRDMGEMMLRILSWQFPKGKPDDHDRPLEETMRSLLQEENARDWARTILKEYE